MKLSVIICTRNKQAYLKSMWQSLLWQTASCDLFEVIVFDDASTQPYVHSMPRGGLDVKYIRTETPVGLAVGRNCAVAAASGTHLFLTDDDVILSKKCVEMHLDAWQQAGEGNYAYVCDDYYRIRDLGHEVIASCCDGIPPDSEYDSWILRSIVSRLGTRIIPMQFAWMCFVTKNLSLPLHNFRSLRGFDEEFQGWGFEDMEFGVRLVSQVVGRGALYLEGRAPVFHLFHGSPPWNTRGARRNFERLRQKHPTVVPDCWYRYLTEGGQLSLPCVTAP
jgi:glycosyltransferase involved in cell wall biosynthesis